MEDKRTLFALLCIGLIFLLLPYYNEWMGLNPVPLEKPPTEQGSPTQDPITEPTDDSAKTQLIQKPELIEQPQPGTPRQKSTPTVDSIRNEQESFTPREIVVRTPLQEIILSTQGGVILSCKLRKYNHLEGINVELLPPNGLGLGVYLQRDNEREDLSSIEFFTPETNVQVDPGQQRSVSMVAELGNGRRLEKILTFHGDRYGIDLKLRYEGFDNDTEAILAWEKGIAFTERDPDIDLPETRAFAYINEERVEILLDDGEAETWSDKGALKWAGIRNKYFLISYIPTDTEQRSSVVLRGDRQGSQLLPDYSIQVGRRLERSGSWNSTVYIGPLSYDELISYEAELEQAIDFGWPIINQVSRFLLILFIAAMIFSWLRSS